MPDHEDITLIEGDPKFDEYLHAYQNNIEINGKIVIDRKIGIDAKTGKAFVHITLAQANRMTIGEYLSGLDEESISYILNQTR